MPSPYSREFRDDVVAIARRRELPFGQVAKDFGIAQPCAQNRVNRAEIEVVLKPDWTIAEQSELREANKRIRLLEQENEVLRRAAAHLSHRFLLAPHDLPARP